MSERREWFIREWIDVQPDGFLSGKVTDSVSYDISSRRESDKEIHVIELKPGEIVLSREELRAAIAKSEYVGDEGERLFDVEMIERLLFGEETEK